MADYSGHNANEKKILKMFQMCGKVADELHNDIAEVFEYYSQISSVSPV